ncbi:hypothetical protein [Lignipirellula cremea]|uniref:Uncharacterized protein n=1 Tax=Lignipirellula cremea TaxID=2528010 RepID=A0A518E451_9BACT|nr:hypothetical protein [Lignipirellula cremea]QDU98859.1 hypothetical protein Pla8534_67700 [Lignipirellula cremea]
MHCLDLANGSCQCSLDRGNLAFLACVDCGLAIAVGSRQLTAIELTMGKVAAGWPLKLPVDSLPSERGYFGEGHYYLPLNGGAKRRRSSLTRPRSSTARNVLAEPFLAT